MGLSKNKNQGLNVISSNLLDELIQVLIPPSLIILLFLSILEVFYNVSKFYFLIDLFDIYVVFIFLIDLYFRWKQSPNTLHFLKNYYLDIIASIPFNLLFIGVDYFIFIRALRGIRVLTSAFRFLKFSKFIRLLRFAKLLNIKKELSKNLKLKHKKYSPHEKSFSKTLSFKVILLVTINSIMGTGIWFLTSAGAKHAGPASLLSWLILSLIAIYISMCFSELTAMFPKAGGVYEFAKQTYGRFWSFIIGWTTSISGSVTISMLLLGALQYLIPVKYSDYYVFIAIFLVILFNFIAYKGMQTSTYMLVTFALITLFTIIGIIVPGFFSFNIEYYQPFFVFPSVNIMLAIFFIAETFFGWESAIFLSAETKDPKKVMPKALIIGTIIIAIFALLLSFTAMGAIPWNEYAQSVAPLRDLGMNYFGNFGAVAFTILVSTSIIGAVASWIVTSPRLLMALAEDKLFFVHFAKIHPKYKSPYVSIIFQVFIISILVIIGSGSYETLLHLLIPLILILYSAVLLGVVILRIKKPNLERPYKVPFGKIGPIIVVLFMFFLLYMFITQTHDAIDLLRVSVSLILFGIPAYFAIELFYDSKYVNIRRFLYAKVSFLYNLFPFTKTHYDKAIRFLKVKDNDVIIDYDCRFGEFIQTLLSKKVNYKKIYAISKSKQDITILNNFLASLKKKKSDIPNKLNKSNCSFCVDIHYSKPSSFLLPNSIKKIDCFFSFNSIGYVTNLNLFFKNINDILKRDGRFCFYIKHSIINLTPNALIIEDKNKLKNYFTKNNLEFNYLKRKTLLGTEIFIYGSKLK
jgi:APA family basic amino acid/polyamine antiporter